MNWDIIYIMRHEVLLTLLILHQLIGDLSETVDRRRHVFITVLLFAAFTVVGWLPSRPSLLFGNMYVSDDLRLLLKNILSVSALIILLQSTTWLNNPLHQKKAGAFYLLIFSTLMGMFFMISAGDFLMLYLGLELATIPLTLLAAFDKDFRKSAEAGVKLLMSSAVSSAVLLFGISMIYGVYGTLHFSEIAGAYNESPLMILGLVFFLSGLAFKISLVPFHLWTADVYEGAPLAVTTYFSVVSKGAAVFTLMLVLYQVFGSQPEIWSSVLYFLAIATMLVGNLFALRQKNMKRFLAFSSITQAGFMMLGFLNAGTIGMTTIVYFMLIYGLSNLAVFGVLSIIMNGTDKEGMDDLNGLYATNPGLSLIMLVSLFSLAGIPPVAGFFGKFFLFTAAASAGMYWLVFFAVINATISLYYYLLVVKAMFINKNETPIARLTSTFYEKLALTLCLVGVLVIGFASPVFEYIRSVM
ncbi:NADH-quinone oxidoreductase subunit N [uncultured Imperialibacter sp.]|uniref:NADH-quinone oxidoreductase subunit N n=1 Tax=uncultured Imperialibacter sp. TaxID=1672639 RepID=UPI0030D8CEF5|tara:strand:- start:57699 stop:59108 length:1410 start_codon:yes stop_codon:yes gene_type:complete